MRFNGRSDRTIKPGATEELAVTLSCSKLKGNFTRNIVVTTNDPDHPRETLVCKGRVLDGAMIAPNYLNFGPVLRTGPTQQRTVSITRGDGGPLNPKLLPVNTPGIDADLKEIEAGSRYELLVSLTPSLALERTRAVLRLQTGVAQANTATIPVYATLMPQPRPADRPVGSETQRRHRETPH